MNVPVKPIEYLDGYMDSLKHIDRESLAIALVTILAPTRIPCVQYPGYRLRWHEAAIGGPLALLVM